MSIPSKKHINKNLKYASKVTIDNLTKTSQQQGACDLNFGPTDTKLCFQITSMNRFEIHNYMLKIVLAKNTTIFYFLFFLNVTAIDSLLINLGTYVSKINIYFLLEQDQFTTFVA